MTRCVPREGEDRYESREAAHSASCCYLAMNRYQEIQWHISGNAIAAEIAPPGPGSRSLGARCPVPGAPRPFLSPQSSVLSVQGFLLLSHKREGARRSWIVVYMGMYTTIHDHAHRYSVEPDEPGGVRRVGSEGGEVG